jgi:hypothetical protein
MVAGLVLAVLATATAAADFATGFLAAAAILLLGAFVALRTLPGRRLSA